MCSKGASADRAPGNRGGPSFYVYAAGLMDETLYDGQAHEAAFYVPAAGMVRFVLSPAGASAYVRSGNGALARPWRGSSPGIGCSCRLASIS
jgi:hypothetical protein